MLDVFYDEDLVVEVGFQLQKERFGEDVIRRWRNKVEKKRTEKYEHISLGIQ